MGEIQHAVVQRTGRGIEIIKFTDRYGEACSLQQSSLAEFEPPGSSAVWLGMGDTRMHLDVEQVRSLVGRLTNWLDTGSFDPLPDSPTEGVK